MGALGSAWPTLRADMTLITDDWLQSCLLQIIPHMFLHTIPTILILDNIRIYLMGFYILCKQYCTWLNSILHFFVCSLLFCIFVFCFFSFHIMCLCILCICILILSGPGYAQYISTTGLPPVPIVPFPAFERHYNNLHSRFHIITGATAVSWRKL